MKVLPVEPELPLDEPLLEELLPLDEPELLEELLPLDEPVLLDELLLELDDALLELEDELLDAVEPVLLLALLEDELLALEPFPTVVPVPLDEDDEPAPLEEQEASASAAIGNTSHRTMRFLQLSESRAYAVCASRAP